MQRKPITIDNFVIDRIIEKIFLQVLIVTGSLDAIFNVLNTKWFYAVNQTLVSRFAELFSYLSLLFYYLSVSLILLGRIWFWSRLVFFLYEKTSFLWSVFLQKGSVGTLEIIITILKYQLLCWEEQCNHQLREWWNQAQVIPSSKLTE